MEFITIKDLNNDIISNINKVPVDVDLIVGIPRSGLLAAELIALYVNKPLTDIDSFIEGKVFSSGKTKNTSNFTSNFTEMKKVLIVEDSVDSGNSIRLAKEKLQDISNKKELIYLTIYTRTDTKDLTDIYFKIIDDRRVFEWNYLHNNQLNDMCFDIDGVLCCDPSKNQTENEKEYEKFLLNAVPKLITTKEIGYLVTSRLEKYRSQTEQWLKNNNISYNKLLMYPDSVEKRNIPGEHSRFKAEIYKKMSKSTLFIESEPDQAAEINRITKKPVFCVSNQVYYNSTKFAPNLKLQNRILKRKAKNIAKKIVGEELYNNIKKKIKKG